MKQILMIEVSPRGKDSASRSVADTLAARLTDLYPGKDHASRPGRRASAPSGRDHAPGHLDKGPGRGGKAKEAARQSDQLIDELLESDLLVMATPMWNFGIPSALKAWIDLVVRPGRTFRYSDGGVLGLAKDKKAILVLASGGVFTEGPWRPWDFVEPYLRQILGFIGIVDVQTVRVEGMNIPSLAATAVLKAHQAVGELSL